MMPKISKDDFEQWRVDPITQALFNKLTGIAENAKQHWLSVSFQGSIEKVDIIKLAQLRAHNSLCLQIVNMTYEDINESKDDKQG